MDPYVVFYLDKNSVKSNVAKHQGKTPVWNQNLKLKRNNNEDIVRFDVIDHNELLKSQIIGYGSFSLFLILRSPVKKSFTTSLFYKGNKIGCLELEIQFFN